MHVFTAGFAQHWKRRLGASHVFHKSGNICGIKHSTSSVRWGTRVYFVMTSQRVFWINCDWNHLFNTLRGSEGRKLFGEK